MLRFLCCFPWLAAACGTLPEPSPLLVERQRAFEPPEVCGVEWRTNFHGGVLSAEATRRALRPVVDALKERTCRCAEGTPARDRAATLRFALESTPGVGEGRAVLKAAHGGADTFHACVEDVPARFDPWQLGTCADPSQGHATVLAPLVVNL